MTFARQQSLNIIIQALSFIESSVSYSNDIHLTDINSISEDFFALFLSPVYKLQLSNLNLQSQYPAIDLGDSTAGVCFQVTADAGKPKVKGTIARFVDHDVFKVFPHLRVLIIGKRKGKYSGLTTPPGTIFNPDNDVIGLPDLVRHIKTLSTPDLEHLEEIVYREVPLFRKATQVQHQDDKTSLSEYRSFFDRPALLDPWYAERDFRAFGKALTDLIQLLNTGWIDGEPVAKKRMKIENADWRDILAKITGQLIVLRRMFTIHVRTGEIDLDHNRCTFKDQSVPRTIDAYKQSILGEMNSLLTIAGLPDIPT